MMPQARRASAYLVTPYLLAASGDWVEQGGTVCFDLALAMEMAETDGAVMDRVCVFALDALGTQLHPGPIAVIGPPLAEMFRRHKGRQDRPASVWIS